MEIYTSYSVIVDLYYIRDDVFLSKNSLHTMFSGEKYWRETNVYHICKLIHKLTFFSKMRYTETLNWLFWDYPLKLLNLPRVGKCIYFYVLLVIYVYHESVNSTNCGKYITTEFIITKSWYISNLGSNIFQFVINITNWLSAPK